MVTKSLYVVHCIDTEGPLHESLDATFERLNATLGLSLTPDQATLKKIQAGTLPLNGKEDVARQMVSPEMLDYNDDWGKLDAMLDELQSEEFRLRYQDSEGQGWLFNWFIMDHVDYVANPRRRDMGYLNIFDHYARRLRDPQNKRDEIHWHYHPMSIYREAHTCATSFLRSPHAIEGLCRRVIDRKWFPSCFRAGFHTERPDNHWFLEQWIPFDFTNQSVGSTSLENAQSDIVGGRFGDWRRAPADWSPYHPAHDDYQVPGSCNRVIFRSLNVGTRLRLIDQTEVDKAFARADQGLPTVLAFADHDWRDMRRDVAQVHSLLTAASKKHPDVKWCHAGASGSAKAALQVDTANAMELSVHLEKKGTIGRLVVTANQDTFGPQPFLAIKTGDQRYIHDNFDFDIPRRRWTYTFDAHTVKLSTVEKVGVAVNAKNGTTSVVVLDPTNDNKEVWNG